MVNNDSVFIVEDELIISLVLKKILNDNGFVNVDVFENGQDVLEKMEDKKYPRLMLVDIRLNSGMDGIDLVETIKKDEEIPVIFISSYSDDETIDRAKSVNPFAYLIKPVKERELIINVTTALYKSRADNQIRNNEKWFYSIVSNLKEAVVAFDEKNNIRYYNGSFLELQGIEKKMSNNELMNLLSENVINRDLIWTYLNYDRDVHKKEIDFHNLGGLKIPVSLSMNLIKNENNIMGRVFILKDISKEICIREKLKNNVKSLETVLMKTVKALGNALEMRDPYTAGHQERVAVLSKAIGCKMKLSEDDLFNVYVAALLHDIGKISIPSDILAKPSKLSRYEMELIKEHPLIGYNIIKDIPFQKGIDRIVLQHHERLDGSGYPNHLKSEEIMLEAKIIGVADVVEAMSSHRPYRPALGVKEALKEISEKKGTLYDKKVVEICIDLCLNDKFTFNKG